GNQITVTSPNGGENWQAGSSRLITWDDNISANVIIELFKGGTFHSTIATTTPSDGSESWTIPTAIESGSDYEVKITMVEDPNIFDFSDSNFTIIGNQITVTSPNGGENWQASSTQLITWDDNISANVTIELYKGGLFHSTIVATTPSDGSENWTIPAGIESGSDYKVKITMVGDPNIFDSSDSNFTIIGYQITVTSPNGGENWQAGTTQNITWSDNINENITIDLYKGGIFHSVISPSTSSDGIKVWDIPFELESGTDYTVKVTSTTDPDLFDYSNANFTIIGNQIEVITPNGSENWLIDSANLITWTDNITGNVEIQLYKGDSFHSSITTSTASDGSYTWNIPAGTISGSNYKIRIASVINSNIFDESDANFTLSNVITVTTPNGGESWQAGTSKIIKWSDNITGNVKIDLYTNSGFDSEITPSTPSTGSYTWNISAATTAKSDYRVKITSIEDASIFDFSDAIFEIFEGNITVVSPNGGEIWQAGTVHNINWTDNIEADVTIELYKGGTINSIIESSTASDGARNWTIPFTQEAGNDYRIKITSVDDPAITDFSNLDFTIVENHISVTSPNGGENWFDTENHVITWTSSLLGNVEIQLFKSDVFHSSIVTSTLNDGEFTWNLPGTTISASDYKIKIISVDDANVYDFSDANFTIINNDLTLIAPNGGEQWLTGSTKSITWTDDISGDVKIDLYKSGVFDSQIIAATPSDGSFTWNIPAATATSPDYKIRITSVDQPVLFDESNANFTIFTGGITVSSPNGGESWQAATSQIIIWNDNLSENVTIDLYKGGILHTIIDPSTASDGTKNWDIPFDQESGSDYSIKITSIDNPDIFDFSDNNFTIVGKRVTVSSPNGGESYLIGSSQVITWTDNLAGNVEIQLFKGGVFNSSITASTPSDGEFTWNISNSLIQASDYTIKISSVDYGNIFDFSDANFTLSKL
ncbi:MAG: Ser-Thr-rich GPI-anchored membrane family protein, partial [Ignavibacteriaceae bacterium]